MNRQGIDRKGNYQINGFSLFTDKDHLGYYRGNQALSKKYRGWHYHIESEKYTQIQIMRFIEEYLIKINAIQVKDKFPMAIGIVEAIPEIYSFWKLDGKTCVLWISGFNGKLHIEANKEIEFTQSLLKKEDLLKILRNING
jgi:hypothetical protein